MTPHATLIEDMSQRFIDRYGQLYDGPSPCRRLNWEALALCDPEARLFLAHCNSDDLASACLRIAEIRDGIEAAHKMVTAAFGDNGKIAL